MNREIKFRIWDALNQKMELFDLYSIWQKDIGQGYYDTMINQTCLFSPSAGENPDLKIMQATGIKDKNGKEIYEGDIYLCTRFINQKIKRFLGVITYRYAGFIILGFGENAYGIDISTDGEVLGNICENPDFVSKSAWRYERT